MDTSAQAIQFEKRRSKRIVAVGSNEDVVIFHVGDEQHLATILDLSDEGICVSLVEPGALIEPDDTLRISLYHNHEIKDIEVRVCRKAGQVIGLEFLRLSDQAEEHVRAKIIGLAVKWMRKRSSFQL